MDWLIPLTVGISVPLGIALGLRMNGATLHRALDQELEHGRDAAFAILNERIEPEVDLGWFQAARQAQRAAALGLLGLGDHARREAEAHRGALLTRAFVHPISWLGWVHAGGDPQPAEAALAALEAEVEARDLLRRMHVRHRIAAVRALLKPTPGEGLPDEIVRTFEHMRAERGPVAVLVSVCLDRVTGSGWTAELDPQGQRLARGAAIS